MTGQAARLRQVPSASLLGAVYSRLTKLEQRGILVEKDSSWSRLGALKTAPRSHNQRYLVRNSNQHQVIGDLNTPWARGPANLQQHAVRTL